MSLQRVGDDAFARQVLEAERPVVVEFSADWCTPCRDLAPELDELARTWAGRVDFVEVDVDAAPQVVADWGVRSIPVVGLFRGGRPRRWSMGAKPAHVIEAELGLAEAAAGEDRPTLLQRLLGRR